MGRQTTRICRLPWEAQKWRLLLDCQPSYVNHVLHCIDVFFILFSYGLPHGAGVCSCVNGLVHNLLMQIFNRGSSIVEVSETYFLDVVTTENDHPADVKHFLGTIYVSFISLGYGGLGWGESPKGLAHNFFMHFFLPLTTHKTNFSKVVLSIS